MNRTIFLLAIVSQTTLTACETIMTNLPGVYKIDIEQGNIIDQSMIDQLRPNMTKRQVLYIMGSPMLQDTFHEQRWDYLYSEQPGGEARTQKRVTLYFNDDSLIGVQGDFRPSTLPVVKESTETSVEVPKRHLDSTMWEKITSLFGGGDSDQATATDDESDNAPKASPQVDYEIGTKENPI
ncbi:outer membrane protein assembly factor BamE [Methylomonas sp. MgM2]